MLAWQFWFCYCSGLCLSSQSLILKMETEQWNINGSKKQRFCSVCPKDKHLCELYIPCENLYMCKVHEFTHACQQTYPGQPICFHMNCQFILRVQFHALLLHVQYPFSIEIFLIQSSRCIICNKTDATAPVFTLSMASLKRQTTND